MNKLQEIFAHKRLEVDAARQAVPVAALRDQIAELPVPRGFRRALIDGPRPTALIAEVKKSSPSQGMIREDFDAVDVARIYAEVGATCLSVLTDERYFSGSAENLRRVRQAVSLPLLRKDFVYDSYQLLEARAWGADAVLLIVAGLEVSQLKELNLEARDLGMDVLVEVHNAAETDVALEMGADLIGVNNRDLATFTTNLSTSDTLLPLITPHAVGISESALASHADVSRVTRAGARGVLIGTTFCSAPDIAASVREVMQW